MCRKPLVNNYMTQEKYQRGKIYKLVDNITQKIYIGSTCNTLPARKHEHKKNYINYIGGVKNNYISAFDIVKNDNFDIYLIE